MQNDISIVPFTPDHIGRTFLWVQDPELRRLFLMRGDVTWEGHQTYFSRVLADPTQRVYAIMAGEQHVGNCGLKNLGNNKGELWIYIGESSMVEKGIGGKAATLLADEGFNVLGLNKIIVHAADFNAPAIALYKKLGFQEVQLEGSADEWSARGCRVIRMELKK